MEIVNKGDRKYGILRFNIYLNIDEKPWIFGGILCNAFNEIFRILSVSIHKKCNRRVFRIYTNISLYFVALRLSLDTVYEKRCRQLACNFKTYFSVNNDKAIIEFV